MRSERHQMPMRPLQRLATFYKVVNTLRNMLIVLIFGFIVISGALAIFLRYMPHLKTLPWVDEILRYLNIWLVFLGASVAVKQGNHLNVDFFIKKMFPGQSFKLVKKITLLVILTCLTILIVAGTRKVLSTRNVVIQAAPLPIALFYLAIPVGCAFMFLDYLLILFFGDHPFNDCAEERTD